MIESLPRVMIRYTMAAAKKIHSTDVVEELLRRDGHEDDAVRHLVLHQRVVGDHPAADAAGGEDVAHGEAAQRDRPDLAQAHADVEHPQDVAEEIGVAGQRGDLERDGGARAARSSRARCT